MNGETGLCNNTYVVCIGGFIYEDKSPCFTLNEADDKSQYRNVFMNMDNRQLSNESNMFVNGGMSFYNCDSYRL